MTLPSLSARALAATACIVTLLASTCGPPRVTVTPSSSTPASSVPTAAPSPFAGAGFRTDIPAGWQDQTSSQSAVASLTGSGTVLMLLASPDHGLIVARTTAQPVGNDQLAQYLTSIKPAGATGVTPAEPVSIDGASGVVTTYLVVPSGGAGQETVAMVVNRAGNTYEVALITAQAGGPDATALQEVLNSWTWA